MRHIFLVFLLSLFLIPFAGQGDAQGLQTLFPSAETDTRPISVPYRLMLRAKATSKRSRTIQR